MSATHISRQREQQDDYINEAYKWLGRNFVVAIAERILIADVDLVRQFNSKKSFCVATMNL
jgi:hypothetical protein